LYAFALMPYDSPPLLFGGERRETKTPCHNVACLSIKAINCACSVIHFSERSQVHIYHSQIFEQLKPMFIKTAASEHEVVLAASYSLHMPVCLSMHTRAILKPGQLLNTCAGTI
jgi:hypothetical protein